jgi:hypothetical protein
MWDRDSLPDLEGALEFRPTLGVQIDDHEGAEIERVATPSSWQMPLLKRRHTGESTNSSAASMRSSMVSIGSKATEAVRKRMDSLRNVLGG